MLMTFISVSLMPIGDAEALIYTSPIFVIFLSVILLGHKIKLYKFTIVALTTLGAWFIVEPETVKGSSDPQDESYFIGVFLALTTAFFIGIQIVTVFKLQKIHPYNLMFNSGICGLFLAIIICPTNTSTQLFNDDNPEYFYLCVSAVLGVLGLFLCLYSGQILLPILFSVIRCQEVVLSFIFEAFLEYHVPSLLTIIGAILVISGSMFIPLESFIINQFPYECIRKIL